MCKLKGASLLSLVQRLVNSTPSNLASGLALLEHWLIWRLLLYYYNEFEFIIILTMFGLIEYYKDMKPTNMKRGCISPKYGGVDLVEMPLWS